jgi:hypothetical protein
MAFVNVFAFSVELAHEIARGYGKSDETVLAGILDREARLWSFLWEVLELICCGLSSSTILADCDMNHMELSGVFVKGSQEGVHVAVMA